VTCTEATKLIENAWVDFD